MLEQQSLAQRFQGWPLIQITETAGMPPEVYRIHYSIKGLYPCHSFVIYATGRFRTESKLYT
jgi:hypothetical protein